MSMLSWYRVLSEKEEYWVSCEPVDWSVSEEDTWDDHWYDDRRRSRQLQQVAPYVDREKKTQDVVDFGILGTKESIGKNKGTEMSILAQSCSLGCSVIITQLISILVSSEDATLCE